MHWILALRFSCLVRKHTCNSQFVFVAGAGEVGMCFEVCCAHPFLCNAKLSKSACPVWSYMLYAFAHHAGHLVPSLVNLVLLLVSNTHISYTCAGSDISNPGMFESLSKENIYHIIQTRHLDCGNPPSLPLSWPPAWTLGSPGQFSHTTSVCLINLVFYTVHGEPLYWPAMVRTTVMELKSIIIHYACDWSRGMRQTCFMFPSLLCLMRRRWHSRQMINRPE